MAQHFVVPGRCWHWYSRRYFVCAAVGSETPRGLAGEGRMKDVTSFARKHRKLVNMPANGWIRDAM